MRRTGNTSALPTIGIVVDVLVIEYPNWQGSAKGLIAMQMGYTLDLAFMAGAMASSFGVMPENLYLPTPMQWKGNMPKTATVHRVQKEFGILQISEHEFDAVGMIQWVRTQHSP